MPSLGWAVLVAVLSPISSGSLVAQAPLDEGFGEEIDVHLVEISVIVERGGQFVRNLVEDDFRVLEDGQERSIV